MTPIARFAVDRRVTMGMVLLGILVLGWLSLDRLPLEFLPTFSSSSISINAPYRSSSPEEIQRLIVQPLEDSLSTINGVDSLSATSSPDSASLRLRFVDGTDMDLAAVDVRDRIDRVRHLLPDDLDRLTIRRFQSTDIPVLSLRLSATWKREELFDFAEDFLRRRLERLEGVAQVDIRGVQTPRLQIDIQPSSMQAHGIDVRQLVGSLRRNNVNVSAGEIKVQSRKLLVRSIGELTNLEDFRRLPLNANGLRLQDVARVEYTFPRQDSFNFLNGSEALTVRINKVSQSNLLEVVDRVKHELAAVQALPEAEGLALRIYHDASDDVRKGLGQLRNAGLIGGGLAILAVFFFLRRFRTTFLVAVAIPVSVVFTFVLLYFLRQAGASEITLNVVSLAGLMLALGMLVDNSVVVIESIFRHRNELGEDSRTAALAGTSEVTLPIAASTVTTLCVFLPLIFMRSGGRMTVYLENIATTVSIVMLASLLVALTVVPMVAVIVLKNQTSRSSAFIARMIGIYGRALGFTLRHRGVFVAAIVLLLAGSVYLFTTIDRSFASRSEERQVTVHVDTPRQYSLAQTEALYAEIYELLDRRREELDIADISFSYNRRTGRSSRGYNRSRRFEIYLVDEEEGRLTTAEARERVRELLPVKAGANLRIGQGRGRHGNTGVEIELKGHDPAVLQMLSRRLVERLEELPMLRDVDTSLEGGDEEIHVGVQQDRILQAGLSSEAVAWTIANALSSRAISHFKTEEREVDVVLQHREEDRETLDQLKNVAVFAAGSGDGPGARLPLNALADFEFVAGPRAIERENHLSKVSITANTTSSRASFGALTMVDRIMAGFPLPPGYEWSFGRWNRYQREDQQTSYFALIFAALLVYMLMASLFESFAQPFTIMFSVPFALLGVGVVMKLAEQPWDSMTTIGLVILLGVVVNNAIVLIHHINRLREQGLDRTQAIIRGGRHRFRPILITAVTTILGLMPMVAPILFPQWFGPVEGRAGTWAPIGLVIMAGLTTSTFLTLMIIPTVYSLIDDFTLFLERVARAL